MILRAFVPWIAGLFLVGCERAPEPDPDQLARAQNLVNEEFELRGPRTFESAWLLRGDPQFEMICGIFEAEEIAKPYVNERRFVYAYGEDNVMIDPIPELNITSSSQLAGTISKTHETIDQLWQESCEPFRPRS